MAHIITAGCPILPRTLRKGGRAHIPGRRSAGPGTPKEPPSNTNSAGAKHGKTTNAPAHPWQQVAQPAVVASRWPEATRKAINPPCARRGKPAHHHRKKQCDSLPRVAGRSLSPKLATRKTT